MYGFLEYSRHLFLTNCVEFRGKNASTVCAIDEHLY